MPVVYVQLNRAIIANRKEVLAGGRTVGLEYNHLALVLVLTLPEETVEAGLIPADADIDQVVVWKVVLKGYDFGSHCAIDSCPS